jgi:hypothetical protein
MEQSRTALPIFINKILLLYTCIPAHTQGGSPPWEQIKFLMQLLYDFEPDHEGNK